jgi:hypothetical protein
MMDVGVYNFSGEEFFGFRGKNSEISARIVFK